jgi:oligopeptide/dipeptide ABC transporter ATP-binding protein
MLLQMKNLTKHFDLGHGRMVHALDGVSMGVAEGTILGLVGESGSGKSTLGKTVVGLLDRTDGEVIYRGEPLARRYRPRDFRRLSKEMQMIFQDPYSSLNPRLTVGELVAEPLRVMATHASTEQPARVVQWLKKVGLSADHLARYPHELSGGQRQRVGIARALIVEPRLVICDEAVSALDVSVQAQVANLLLDLKESMGLTLVFIAHNLSMVHRLADRMAVMYLGVLVEEGPTEEVYREPAHPYTRALIAAIPEPDPRHENLRRHIPIAGEIASPIDLPPGCRFAARCPSAIARCHAEVPQLLPAGDDRRVACHLVPNH